MLPKSCFGITLACAISFALGTPVAPYYNTFIPRNVANTEYSTDANYPDHVLSVSHGAASLGADNVTQYSGYLDINTDNRHLFYWFFESRNDPANDPIILWLNGGPGCSSLEGLLFENGPSLVNEDLQLVRNPFSWNNKANVIYLDQPVNVGFSYSGDDDVDNTVTAAEDVYAFLQLFFQKYPKYSNLPFHVSGESYAGHYIPAIAAEILKHDDRAFNFASIVIGNGITDSLVQSPQYPPMACGEGGYPSVTSPDRCAKMYSYVPTCVEKLTDCYETYNNSVCLDAQQYCEGTLMAQYQGNYYDVRTPCDPGASLCYKGIDWVNSYFQQDFVKAALGANPNITFTSCSDHVGDIFQNGGDWSKPFQQDVTTVLEQGYGALIYAGDKDYIANWLGNHAWTDQLPWSGHFEFSYAPFTPWFANGNYSGQAKNHGKFTFLRVFESGHMVPHDQPQSASYMINSWISGNLGFR